MLKHDEQFNENPCIEVLWSLQITIILIEYALLIFLQSGLKNYAMGIEKYNTFLFFSSNCKLFLQLIDL